MQSKLLILLISLSLSTILSANPNSGLIEAQNWLRSIEREYSISELKEINDLDLRFSKAKDKGIGSLKHLKKLTLLDLGGTNITNKGVIELKQIKSLEVLYLIGTKINEKCIPHLKEMKNLKVLYLLGTKINSQAKEDLRKSLADCDIF